MVVRIIYSDEKFSVLGFYLYLIEVFSLKNVTSLKKAPIWNLTFNTSLIWKKREFFSGNFALFALRVVSSHEKF